MTNLNLKNIVSFMQMSKEEKIRKMKDLRITRRFYSNSMSRNGGNGEGLKYPCLSTDLSTSFTWDKSKEGHFFWRSMRDTIKGRWL